MTTTGSSEPESPPRRDSRLLWALAGLGAGLAGLAVSYAVALALTIRESPVVAVAEAVIRLTPGALAEWAIQTLGHWDKPVLVAVILGMLVVLFAVAGLLCPSRLHLRRPGVRRAGRGRGGGRAEPPGHDRCGTWRR